MYKTGGGTYIPKTTALDRKLVESIPKQFFSLENVYDSNVIQIPLLDANLKV